MGWRRYAKYLDYVVRHKFYVGVACLEEGLVIRALTHDLTKLLPLELLAYARHFRNPDGTRKEDVPDDLFFNEAWLAHQNRNSHHWQHYLLTNDDGTLVALPMSPEARLEMVCDWKGAGKALGFPGTWESTRDWYETGKARRMLHLDTQQWVEDFLDRKVQEEHGQPA